MGRSTWLLWDSQNIKLGFNQRTIRGKNTYFPSYSIKEQGNGVWLLLAFPFRNWCKGMIMYRSQFDKDIKKSYGDIPMSLTVS
jgi:hypothetical protein